MKNRIIQFTLAATLSAAPCINLNAQDHKFVWQNESLPIEERVEMILKDLTIDEKVALCHAQSKFSSKGVARLGIPELHWSDGPHGVRMEINFNDWGHANWKNDSCTAFPALTALAATFDPHMSYLYGQALGEEARYRNKSVILGPGVNIYRTPMNGRNFEYMGEDPFLASIMVAPYIKGVQENGVATSVKHYALNNQEIWRGHINVQVSERALREIYLPAFKAAADAGAWTFMGSYNKYNNQHCCHNEILLKKILKEEWKYDGVVVTDWGGCHDTEEAVSNGLDVEMGTYTNGLTSEASFGYNNYYLADNFTKGIKDGSYPMAALDDKARRIIRLILRTEMNPAHQLGSFASQEHAKVARTIAESAIVLLKNENNILPLQNNIKSIAVIGENATRSMCEGGGSSELKPWREISPLQGIISRYPNAKVIYSMGYGSGRPSYSHEGVSPYNADSLKNAAIETAKNADVVIYVGGLNKNHKQDCEAADRYTYHLPFGQPQLIDAISQVNPNMIVVLLSGNAVQTDWAPKAKAIVQAWYNGSESGNALAAILSGDVNPSGKLPFSFPKKLTDNGAHSFDSLCYPGDSINEVYKEDILVGYRWHDTKKIPAAYPFGFGLSYTTFSFDKVTTDKKEYSKDDTVKVSLSIINSGKVAGAEVIQIYVADPKCSVARPTKELKGFAKVMLNPGESKEVLIDVPVSSFAFFDEARKCWSVEAGEYIINAATSSTEIKSKVKIKVQ